MPTYQYVCTECNHGFEQFQTFNEESLTVCPECAGRLRKVFNAVGVVFKGSGFYKTDSRVGANGNGSAAAASPADSSASTSSSSDSSASSTDSSNGKPSTDRASNGASKADKTNKSDKASKSKTSTAGSAA